MRKDQTFEYILRNSLVIRSFDPSVLIQLRMAFRVVSEWDSTYVESLQNEIPIMLSQRDDNPCMLKRLDLNIEIL
jgi:hypothetical protein